MDRLGRGVFQCVLLFSLAVSLVDAAAISSVVPPTKSPPSRLISLNSTFPIHNSTSPSGNQNGSAIYRPLFAPHRDETPKFVNTTQKNPNPLVVAAAGLSRRQSNGLPEGACAPGTPCSNGACCSNQGWCGYSPDFCGAEVCISNCDAKAQCGQYAAEGHGPCPLNVCCSSSGFCGTTEEFCGAGCDSTFGGCGQPSPPSCGTTNTVGGRRIGYYEGWATTRPCDQRAPEDLLTIGYTHLNFAFAFFNPTTFEMTGMDATTVTLYNRFTALKVQQPGLQTWISVGGWSFNDPTNVPDTRTAFSDMVSTQANRAKFIASLKQFMLTYNFDGVDLDWEYPGADDRGGVPADGANFVELLKEMRTSFGSRYGVSATLPSSYWYLQHFDLPGMEPYVDWFNVMTYDIHGVWDSSNVYAGPYVRPHTNLTEINEGLDLLWRVGVSPSKVTLGLGWYGRSFTLSDPSCNQPWCLFSAGGTAGACSGEAGILSNAEILRQINALSLTPQVDTTAAVAWVTWDDQWVSYDNDETVQLKLAFANSRCLGGTMVWAIDLDDGSGTSLGSVDPNLKILLSHECLYPPCGNGNTFGPRDIFQTSAGVSSCYTSFCNAGCSVGYSAVARMNGQVGYLNFDNSCPPGEYQSLCCADGTTYDTCQWRGYSGLGLSCSGGCYQDETEVAQNTNNQDADPETGFVVDQTCSSGYMSYCCTGFLAAPASGDFDLISQDSETSVIDVSNYDSEQVYNLALQCPSVAAIVSSEGATVLEEQGILEPNVIVRRSIGSSVAWMLICYTTNQVNKKIRAIKGTSGPKQRRLRLGPGLAQPAPNRKKNTVGGNKLGQWTKVSYPPGTQTCSVTYTCQYGGFVASNGAQKIFDQICDNQRYAIENVVPFQNRIYHMATNQNNRNQVQKWKDSHIMAYKSNWFDPSVYPGASLFNSKCQIDEFPQNALAEAVTPQALRAVDGTENSMQGNDFLQWKNAVYNPCSSLLAAQGKPPPPITWTWGGISPTDTRNNGGGIIQKYGFDSSAASQCFATYTKNGIATVVSDHGFRVASTDPLFQPRGGLTWSNQVNVWKNDPANLPITNGFATIVPLPVNVQPPLGFLRPRDIDSTDLEGLGHNDTSQLTVKRENKRYYIEDEKRQVCHQLELHSDGEGGKGDDESIYNEFCANAIVSETPPEPTTTSPSEGKISPADTYYIPEPTGRVPQQGQVKLMALTSTVTAVLPTNI